MHTYGDLPKPAAYGILLLFSLYVALYHAAFGWCIGWLNLKFSRNTVLFMAPVIWVAVELGRSRVTGFPWDLLGYTQVDNAFLTTLAPLTGVMGLSFAVVAVNSVWLWRPKNVKRSFLLAGPVLAAILVSAVTVAGKWSWNSEKPDITATAILLQENLKVGAEAAGVVESKTEMLSSFSRLSEHAVTPAQFPNGEQPIPSPLLGVKPRLIAWPEAPAEFFDSDQEFRRSIGALARSTHTPVIVNDVAAAEPTQDHLRHLYNSAAFFLPDGTYAGRYNKMRLVPFGEYTPFKPLFFFAGHLLGDLPFLPGLERRIFMAESHQYGVFICYESIFGDDIRHFAKDGAEVLVNISDDGWYGDSSAPWEHLDMVRMRAMENDRWIVRATNTGITASIDPLGRITATIPRHIRGSMLAGFGYRRHLTLYTRFGDWFGWLCFTVALCAIAIGISRRRQVH